MFQPVVQCRTNGIHIHRLVKMRVHAALQGSLDVVRKGVRGECENRNTPRVFPCHAAYVPCGFKAVHDRHTDIHQDSGVFPRFGFRKALHRNLAVLGPDDGEIP